MKKSAIKPLFLGPVKRCAEECGNRFGYLPKPNIAVNMECMHCGYQFRTMVDTFSERYEEIGSDVGAKNPKFLFKRNRK